MNKDNLPFYYLAEHQVLAEEADAYSRTGGYGGKSNTVPTIFRKHQVNLEAMQIDKGNSRTEPSNN